jgi:hypothetical protein
MYCENRCKNEDANVTNVLKFAFKKLNFSF